MKAVSDSLLTTILQLQQIPALSKSCLGGGTNLAIRYGHRVSYDIDLFFPGIIGKAGYEQIRKEVEAFYGEAVFAMDYPCDTDDQFLFQRFFIRNDDEAIKVEILQNMQTYHAPEIIDGVKLMNIHDIGPLKLMSASNRANHKDIYDLDYITDHIPLNQLMDLLKHRQELYHQPEHQNIFDQDGEFSPIDKPELLLKFEEPVKGSVSRPGHSNPRIDFICRRKKLGRCPQQLAPESKGVLQRYRQGFSRHTGGIVYTCMRDHGVLLIRIRSVRHKCNMGWKDK